MVLLWWDCYHDLLTHNSFQMCVNSDQYFLWKVLNFLQDFLSVKKYPGNLVPRFLRKIPPCLEITIGGNFMMMIFMIYDIWTSWRTNGSGRGTNKIGTQPQLKMLLAVCNWCDIFFRYYVIWLWDGFLIRLIYEIYKWNPTVKCLQSSTESSFRDGFISLRGYCWRITYILVQSFTPYITPRWGGMNL